MATPQLRDAGYSGTPLAKRLGLKDGQTVTFVALPASLAHLAQAGDFAKVAKAATAGALKLAPHSADVAHAFFISAVEMRAALPALRRLIHDNGMIWISWPKKSAMKSARIAGDVDEHAIRVAALEGDLVDVKVCAVDEVWSGLKLVVRREARAAAALVRNSKRTSR